MLIRDETPSDEAAIRAVVEAAFRTMRFSRQTAVDRGRQGALSVSLVAEEDGAVLGHVAFSPATIDGRLAGCFALGPLAVAPDHQRRGIGSTLVRSGLARLAAESARGCVVLGNPAYYGRFGFRRDPHLTAAGVPAEHFMVRSFGHAVAQGIAAFHPAFAATG